MSNRLKYIEPELTKIEIDTNIVRMLASKPTDGGGLFPGFDTDSEDAKQQSFAPSEIEMPAAHNIGGGDEIKW